MRVRKLLIQLRLINALLEPIHNFILNKKRLSFFILILKASI